MGNRSDRLLIGFDEETASTRKLLACLPDDRYDFKPHPKSMTLGVLAGHVADLPRWAHYVFELDSIDLSPLDGKEQMVHYVAASRGEALSLFDSLSLAAVKLIAQASDELLASPWSFLFKGKTIRVSPREEWLRIWFLNHLIHHRAQLGVYLRLLDISIPGMYGPSADTREQLRADLEK